MNAPSSLLPFAQFLTNPWVLIIWGIVWFCVLYVILTREDFDAANKLLWAVVVILVPFFGVVLYWTAAPAAPAKPIAVRGAGDISGTPWEKDPGHVK